MPLDVSEIRRFVRLNEFGVAFDVLVASIQEQNVALTTREASAVDTLAADLDEHGRWNVS